MSKKWYVKTWMPQGKARRTYEQAIVDADNKAQAKVMALGFGLVASGRNITVRPAREEDFSNPQVRHAR